MTEEQKNKVWQLVNHGPKNNDDWQLIRAYVKYHNEDGDLVNRIAELETDIVELQQEKTELETISKIWKEKYNDKVKEHKKDLGEIK